MVKRFGILIVLSVVLVPGCRAQDGMDVGGMAGGFYGSGGPTMGGGGFFIGSYDTGSFRKITHPGLFFDFGVVGPTPKKQADAVFSLDYQSTYNLRRDPSGKKWKPGLLFLTGGYSGFFNNGHGVNYGGGLMWRFPQPSSNFKALRVEYRESWVPGWGRQPGFRIAFEAGGALD